MKLIHEDIDYDVDEIFKIKNKKERMKYDIDKLEEKKYRSSESELSEGY